MLYSLRAVASHAPGRDRPRRRGRPRVRGVEGPAPLGRRVPREVAAPPDAEPLPSVPPAGVGRMLHQLLEAARRPRRPIVAPRRVGLRGHPNAPGPCARIEERLAALRLASAARSLPRSTADCSFKLEAAAAAREAPAPATPRSSALPYATDARDAHHRRVLMGALDDLVELAAAWSGVSMPSMRSCAQEWP